MQTTHSGTLEDIFAPAPARPVKVFLPKPKFDRKQLLYWALAYLSLII